MQQDNQQKNSFDELPAVAAPGLPIDPSLSAQGMPQPSSSSAPPDDSQARETSQLSAEDVDLIEKEWVVKAKKIVESTQGDPYTQAQELNKIKADYIKKRYNKDIKSNG